jgi:hypothetical protein
MNKLSKTMKRQLRALAGIAYERELSNHLKELARNFNEWEANKIDCWDLSDKIHQFHNGISRELYNLYSNSVDLVLLVSRAIANNLLSRHEISEEVFKITTELTNHLLAINEQ